MPNCLERHSLCTEANWGLPTQHFQKGIVVGINKKYQKHKKKILKIISFEVKASICVLSTDVQSFKTTLMYVQ